MPDRRLWAATVLLAVCSPAHAEPPRLAGIVIAGDERVAIFATGAGEAVLAVREGDQIGGERVTGIHARGVELDSPGGKRLATLGDDTATRTAGEAAIKRPPLIDPYRRERETENDQ